MKKNYRAQQIREQLYINKMKRLLKIILLPKIKYQLYFSILNGDIYIIPYVKKVTYPTMNVFHFYFLSIYMSIAQPTNQHL